MAGFVIVLTWITLWVRFRDAEVVAEPAREDLRVWQLPGCYHLLAGDWTDASVSVRPVPEYLMLLPDSLDQWGRINLTYRARPLDDEHEGPYRWFVRADTLWVVWSDQNVPGGLALREAPDGYLGRARVGGEFAAVDVTARVQAWRVNCGTREIEGRRSVRR